MNYKKLIKNYKTNESTISMVLGVIVILIVGFFIVKNFKNENEGETIPSIGTEELTPGTQMYTVQKGDDLWKISENFLGTGYEWKRIADANNIASPYGIEVGQELTIPPVITETILPEVTPEEGAVKEVVSPTETVASPTETPVPTETLLPTITPSEEVALSPTPTEAISPTVQAIEGDSYTVVKGDNLWNISVRAYGDGFKWTEIAKANNLTNPGLIHSGNTFVIPR